MNEKDMKIDLWSKPEKAEFFVQISRLFKKDQKTPVKVALFFYDPRYKLEEIFNDYWPSGYENIKIEKTLVDNERIFNFKFYDENNEKIIHSCLLIDFKDKPFSFLLSNTNYIDFKYNQLRFFNKYYPLLSRVFFRSVELLEILNDLEKNKNIQIDVEKYVGKRFYGDKESRISFKNAKYYDVFLEAIEQRLWVDSLTAKLNDKSGVLFGKIRIGRDGIFSYSIMDFSKFFNQILERILTKWYEERYKKTLENRERSLEIPEPKPIKITLKRETFLDKEDIEKFLDSIHSFPNWGYSIFSLQKSFVFMNIFDYVSGGSFDIMIPSSKEIYVIPQTQITANVINRLLSFLIDNYEGEIENV